MLKLMRQHIKFFGISLWLVVGAFVATIFVVWGMGDYQGGGQQGGVEVAYVNGEPINVVDYQRVYYNLYDFYREVFKDKSADEIVKEMNLKQKALDDLVSARLMLQAAQGMGFTVTDEELRDRILSSPTFQENGAFSRDRYRQILDANRLTPAQFEKYQRNEILQEKFRSMIRDTVAVSEDEMLKAVKERLSAKPIELADLDRERETIRREILAQKQEMAVISYISAMRNKADIEVVQAVLDKAA